MEHTYTDLDTGARVTISAPGRYPNLGPTGCETTGDPAHASRLGFYAEILRLAERVEYLERYMSQPALQDMAEKERKLREALAECVAELERPNGLHEYRDGLHINPKICAGCQLLHRLRALLKEE